MHTSESKPLFERLVILHQQPAQICRNTFLHLQETETRLDVEAELDDVAVLDDVFLALDAEAARFAGLGE